MKKNHILIKCFVLLLSVFVFNVKMSKAADVHFIEDRVTMHVVVGYDFTLQVKGMTENPTWRSSDEEIVTVNGSGEVTPVEVGSAKITAQIGNKKYNMGIKVFESDKNRVGKKIDAEQPEYLYTIPYGARATVNTTWGKGMSGWKWFVFPKKG
ncbi:MAG: Ig-like domain-containing protein [Roseburia sp.]|nr:Ig-like domain-containing protein [Roseburia sp.]